MKKIKQDGQGENPLRISCSLHFISISVVYISLMKYSLHHPFHDKNRDSVTFQSFAGSTSPSKTTYFDWVNAVCKLLILSSETLILTNLDLEWIWNTGFKKTSNEIFKDDDSQNFKSTRCPFGPRCLFGPE